MCSFYTNIGYYKIIIQAKTQEMEIYNDDLEILDLVENGYPRRVYDRSNYFQDMDNLTFFKRFRLTRPTVLAVLQEIEDQLEFDNDRNRSVYPMNQLLTALRFFATGGHISAVGDFMGIHESTASRIVQKVSLVLAGLRPRYICMPQGEQIISSQRKFFQVASFPRVIGCIDCTHVKIISPGGHDAEVFRNRKGYFSVNVQAVSSADLKIINVVARWPGSAHDSTIFANSRIRASFENNEYPNCVLLGDSGYALKNYLLTPLPEVRNRGEQLYNESQIRTRNCVERLFGVWKRRFPVLAYGLRLKLETSLSIIVATAVLHNIARSMNEEEPPLQDEARLNYLIEMGMIPDQPVVHNADLGARIFRNEIINYFQNRQNQ